ncbi:MAG: hypothetical protein RIS84_681 [Pseudomonadota bacterium]|jgi:hypothetical protein
MKLRKGKTSVIRCFKKHYASCTSPPLKGAKYKFLLSLKSPLGDLGAALSSLKILWDSSPPWGHYVNGGSEICSRPLKKEAEGI